MKLRRARQARRPETIMLFAAAKPRRRSDAALSPRPVGLAKLALADLSVRVAGKPFEEVDRLRALVTGEALATEGDHVRGRSSGR